MACICQRWVTRRGSSFDSGDSKTALIDLSSRKEIFECFIVLIGFLCLLARKPVFMCCLCNPFAGTSVMHRFPMLGAPPHRSCHTFPFFTMAFARWSFFCVALDNDNEVGQRKIRPAKRRTHNPSRDEILIESQLDSHQICRFHIIRLLTYQSPIGFLSANWKILMRKTTSAMSLQLR